MLSSPLTVDHDTSNANPPLASTSAPNCKLELERDFNEFRPNFRDSAKLARMGV